MPILYETCYIIRNLGPNISTSMFCFAVVMLLGVDTNLRPSNKS